MMGLAPLAYAAALGLAVAAAVFTWRYSLQDGQILGWLRRWLEWLYAGSHDSLAARKWWGGIAKPLGLCEVCSAFWWPWAAWWPLGVEPAMCWVPSVVAVLATYRLALPFKVQTEDVTQRPKGAEWPPDAFLDD